MRIEFQFTRKNAREVLWHCLKSFKSYCEFILGDGFSGPQCKWCKFDGKRCNSNQNWNNVSCWCECKNLEKHRVCEKDFIWNPATCSCENGKYYWRLTSIIDDSVITCDRIIEETKITPTKTVPTNFNEKKVNRKAKNLYIFTHLFINYHIIIDCCYYLLSSEKILNKTKTFSTISRHKYKIKVSFI